MAESAKAVPTQKVGPGGANAARAAGTASQRAVVETAVVAADGTVRIAEARGNVASIEIADVDLLIRFADGRNIVIPNGALDAMSGKPVNVQFKDSSESAAELLKHAGKTTAVTLGNVRIITDQLDTYGADNSPGPNLDAPDAAQAPVPPAPTYSAVPVPPLKGTGKGTGKGSGAGEGDIPDVVQSPHLVKPPVYRVGRTIDDWDPYTGNGIPTVEGDMYGRPEYKLTPSGRTDLPRAAYNPNYDPATDLGQQTPFNSADGSAVNDPRLPQNQSYRESIAGTAGGDSLDYNSSLALGVNTNVLSRVMHLDISNFSTLNDLTVTTADGVGIYMSTNQATKTAGKNEWTIDMNAVTKDAAGNYSIELIVYYDPIADGLPIPSLQASGFPLQVQASGLLGAMPFISTHVFTLKYSDSVAVADFQTLGLDGLPIYLLPARGIGYDIDLGAGDDTIHAGAGADSVVGGSGNDSILGDTGNDTLNGGTGADYLDGGTGANTATYADAAAGVVVSLSPATAVNGVTFTAAGRGVLMAGVNAGEADGDTLVDIANLTGSAHDDTLIGDANANSIVGGDGADTLEGRGGADTLEGGDGANTVGYAHAAQGVQMSLDGSLTATNDAAGDVIRSIENLQGSEFDDTLKGGSAANAIAAGGGNDLVIADNDAAADMLDGGAGTDILSYAGLTGGGVTVHLLGATASAVSGGDGADVVSNFENVIGSNFGDSLRGDDIQANSIDGGQGNDTIDGGDGNFADTLAGGGGVNTLSYASHTAAGGGVAVTLSTLGGGTVSGVSGADVITNFTNVIGSGGADTLTGDAFANTISGGNANDVIDGGNDMVVDVLDGGAGVDMLTFAGINNVANFGVALTLNGAVEATIQAVGGNAAAGAGADSVVNFENVTGTQYADYLGGDGNANLLSGGNGNDTIDGGIDALVDTLDGGDGTDTLSFATIANATEWGVDVTLNGATAATVLAVASNGTSGSGADVVSNFENLIGSQYNDHLTGDGVANSLSGGAGDDTIEGGLGDDTLDGGSHAAGDTLSYQQFGVAYGNAAGNVGVTASLAWNGDGTAHDTTGAGAGGGNVGAGLDRIANLQRLIGSGYNDSLTGDANVNTIDGGAGNDTVDGGAGTDSLLGGTGNDVMGGGNDLVGDTLDGGTGTNTLSFSNVTSGYGVSVTLNGATGGTVQAVAGNALAGSGADVFANFSNIVGTQYADSLTGDTGGNTLDGGGGDDTMDGALGQDSLVGGAGNDVLGGGNDTAVDTLDGGAGTNTLTFADITSGYGVSVTLSGATQTTVAAVAGNGGNIGSGADLLVNFSNLVGTQYDDSLTGDTTANAIAGGPGNDTLDSGNDTVADTLDGGGGTDALTFAAVANASSYGIDLTLNGASDATVQAVGANGYAGSGGDAVSSIENVIGTQYADYLGGDGNANLLSGGNGNDTIDGGIDALVDTLDGGDGTDTLSFATLANATEWGVDVTLNGATAATVLAVAGNGTSGSGADVVSNFENLIGSQYNDHLTGDGVANSLSGGAGDDTIEGGLGDDTLDGGSHVAGDTLSYQQFGVAYGNAAGNVGVTASLAWNGDGTAHDTTGVAGGGYVGAGLDRVANLQNLTGSGFNDNLTGDAFSNSIDGGAGDDVLDGGSGADNVVGGLGNDVVSGGNDTAVDTLNGGVGLDTLSFANLVNGTSYGVSLVLAGAANAIVQAVGGNADSGSGADAVADFESVIGSQYADSLVGDTAANTLDGGLGDDTLDGGGGADSLLGSLGNDLMGGGNDTDVDTLDGGADSNTLTFSNITSGYGVSVTLNGATQATVAAVAGNAGNIGSGADVFSNFQGIIGTQYADSLVGDGNANTIEGGAGNDTLNGAAGTDTVSFDSAGNAVAVNLNGAALAAVAGYYDGVAAATATGSATGTDALGAFENILGGAGNDSLFGNNTANYIVGGAGDDWIDGGSGNVNDTLDGGSGTNTVSYILAGNPVTVSLNSLGVAQNTGTNGGTDTLYNFQNLVGSAGNDTLSGASGAGHASNSIAGYNGNDVIYAGSGNVNDTFVGGAGTDTLSYAGTVGPIVLSYNGTTATGTATGDNIGADTLTTMEYFIGTTAADTFTATGTVTTLYLSYSNLATGVALDLADAGSATASGGGGEDVVTGFLHLSGGSGNDTLSGTSGANIIYGGAGNDSIFGDAGNDWLDGGVSNLGNDTLDGGLGVDWANYASASSAVTVSLAIAAAQNTVGAGVDVLTNFENLYGSNYNDLLTGDGGSNSIDGINGNDTLEGGMGNDTLQGNGGTDTVTYANLGTAYGAAGAGVNVSLSDATAQITGSAGTDTLLAIENLSGSAYNDTLMDSGGNATVNVMNGLAGNDVIYSGTLALGGGADSLIGGTGDDVFYVHATAPYARIYGADSTQPNNNVSSELDGVVVRGAAGSMTLASLTGNAGGADASKLWNIEVIDIHGDGVSTTITDNAATLANDVRFITGATSGQANLYVIHDTGDTLPAPAGWSSSVDNSANISFNGVTYNTDTIYDSGAGERLHWLSV